MPKRGVYVLEIQNACGIRAKKKSQEWLVFVNLNEKMKLMVQHFLNLLFPIPLVHTHLLIRMIPEPDDVFWSSI